MKQRSYDLSKDKYIALQASVFSEDGNTNLVDLSQLIDSIVEFGAGNVERRSIMKRYIYNMPRKDKTELMIDLIERAYAL